MIKNSQANAQTHSQRREIPGFNELMGNIIKGGVKNKLNELYHQFQTVQNNEHRTAPTRFSMNIKDINEKACQRAFLNEDCSIVLNGGEPCPVEWIDMKYPLSLMQMLGVLVWI